MKIQVVINQTPVGGYLHINPRNGDNIKELPCANSEATEIIAETICDYIPRHQLGGVIYHYVSKLRHGGRIVIGGTEIKELAKTIIFDDDFEGFNQSIFGNFADTWSIKSGVSSIIEIVDTLTGYGLKITKKRIDNCQFIVEAVRD